MDFNSYALSPNLQEKVDRVLSENDWLSHTKNTAGEVIPGQMAFRIFLIWKSALRMLLRKIDLIRTIFSKLQTGVDFRMSEGSPGITNTAIPRHGPRTAVR